MEKLSILIILLIKLDVDVNIPERLDISKYISAGKPDTEEDLPDEAKGWFFILIW